MPTGVFQRPLTFEQRFWANVDKRGPDECWPIIGARTIWRDGEAVMMPFASWEINVGKLPDGCRPKRTCATKNCTNPQHMQVRQRKSLKGFRRSTDHVTHCVHGHEYTPENTQVRANGARRCKQCLYAKGAAFDAANADRRREQHRAHARYRQALATGEDISCP